jgi:hypothetical protein
MKKQKTTYYKHKKKPIPTYTVLRPFKLKFEGVWYESILYSDIDSGEVYGRVESAFNESFKLVGDE